MKYALTLSLAIAAFTFTSVPDAGATSSVAASAPAVKKSVAFKCGAGQQPATVVKLSLTVVEYKYSTGHGSMRANGPEIGTQKLVVGGKFCIDVESGQD